MTNQPSTRADLYQTEDGRTHIQFRFEDQTPRLTQAQMADLLLRTFSRTAEVAT